ncbi:kynureninase [Candidatus Kapabacteria bacterium]|nr:kynureninase [Candidatus Kapabacteria bacterium]
MNKNTALELDAQDPLKKYRDYFHFPKGKSREKVLYFTGNSLGLQPKNTAQHINQELKDWASFGVEGHFKGKNIWVSYHELLTSKLAKVTGSKDIEVVAMNSLTVNLNLLMVSFYQPNSKKNKIMIESGAFPSDIYAVKSHIKLHGFDPKDCLIELKPREGEHTLRTDDILKAIEENKDELELVMFSGVNYYTGQAFDMKSIAAFSRKLNINCGFDLAHAVGNLDLQLHDWAPDFAVWCTYKYLNSGPGGIGGAFVHERHKNTAFPRLEGWWGSEKENRFKMNPDFVPLEGVEAWQMSNPPIFQLAAHNSALQIFEEAGFMKPLNEKTLKLTGFFDELIKSLGNDKVEVITPSNPADRGCQISIRMKNADRKLFENFMERDVIVDWREPDVIRAAPTPLYNSYLDCFEFYEILKDELSK